MTSEGERTKKSRRQKFNNLLSANGGTKQEFKRRVRIHFEKIDNKHKFSFVSEDNELEELHQLDNNIEVNEIMQ